MLPTEAGWNMPVLSPDPGSDPPTDRPALASGTTLVREWPVPEDGVYLVAVDLDPAAASGLTAHLWGHARMNLCADAKRCCAYMDDTSLHALHVTP